MVNFLGSLEASEVLRLKDTEYLKNKTKAISEKIKSRDPV